MQSNGTSTPPKHVQILVVGGGPAGSYAASALAREGLDVAVFESAKFPRYHVGESMISSIHHYMRFIGAQEKVKAHGFTYKPGAALKFTQYKGEGYTDFIAFGHGNHAYNVVRSEFDELLLNHSKSCGAHVFEQTKAKTLHFSPTDPNKPVSIDWVHTPFTGDDTTPITGNTTFDYLVDASGRAGIMSSHLKNRKFNESLRNLATWGYWRGCGTYGKGTSREGAPWFEALTDESGWAWFIPLHDGTTSVGVVRNKDAPVPEPTNGEAPAVTMTEKYQRCLAMAPNLIALVGKTAELDPKSLKSASDYSYSSPSYAGPGYRIAGDAGCFIDPLFSSGIHLAFTSALSAAASICAELKGDAKSELSEQWHSRRVAISYTRFQLVVLSAYKQMKSQKENVLADFDEDNFDRAFEFLRPVVQGASDMGARLSEVELQKSLDFCSNLFNGTSQEDFDKLKGKDKIAKELLDVSAPVMDPATFEQALGVQSEQLDDEEDEDTLVLKKVNARRLIHKEYAIDNMQSELLDGLCVRLEHGSLGLKTSA